MIGYHKVTKNISINLLIFNKLHYPIAIIFNHFKTVTKAKWKRRAGRINHDNLFIIAIDRDGLTESIMERYARLPYKNIILLSATPYPEYSFVHYFPQYEGEPCLPSMLKITNVFGKREYGQGWDYIKWLNDGQ